MPKRSEISLENCVKIQLLHEQGKSQKEIAKLVKCSRCAVQSAIKRYAETGTHANKPRTGRKRVTTSCQDRKLIRESVKDRKKKSSELAAVFTEETGTLISARTARRRLTEADLKGCKARKKPWLSVENKKKRLHWALRHQHFTVEDWSNVLWSDESNFEVFGTPGVTFVRRRKGEEYHPNCVVPTIKHGEGSVMIWGYMAADRVGKMFICEGSMNSEKYINVLETALKPSLSGIFGDCNLNGVKFQQDNAPCHKSATTMRWFTDNCIDLLDWPAQSPDLDPIEHLWGILKKKIKEHSITSKTALKNALVQEWDAIASEECAKLVRSMVHRVAAVIKSKSGPTKY